LRRLTQVFIKLILLFSLVSAGVLGFLTLTVVGIGDVPEVQPLLTSTFYYQDGQVLATRFEQNRFEVSLADLPPELPKAFIAVEDHRFYRHLGVDPLGLLRAIARNLRAGRLVEGGSTISQQLARNLFLTHERTFLRKMQEALLTLRLERKYTKHEILEKYLNTIYFGHGAYGVEAAARTYFAKPARDLTLAESALLAGIPRGPARYSPKINPEAARNRQTLVLTRMAEEGMITPQQQKEALAEQLIIQERGALRARLQSGLYFVDYLVQELAVLFPDDPQIVFRGGLNIYTTLDRPTQEAAERAQAELKVGFVDKQGIQQPQVALVAVDPRDGSVRALVGGRDFRQTQLNRVLHRAGRSPGSAFKPFVYAAALEAGFTPANVHTSEPVTYQLPGQSKPYAPIEYGNIFYHIPMTMRVALARSSNVVAVKTLMENAGPERTLELARRLGIQSVLQPFPSLAVGAFNVTPLEMALAYAPFANQGFRVKPLFITRITAANGQVLYEKRPALTPVLDPRIAYLMTDMLKSVLQPGGTAAGLGPLLGGRPAAAKTGTSQGHRDSYIVGYAPQLVTAVWVGNDDNSSLGWGATGAQLAGPLWANFMRNALIGAEPADFERPAGLTSRQICPQTGMLHNPRCRTAPIDELFIAGTEAIEQCRWPLCPDCPPEWQWHWDDGRNSPDAE